MCGSSIPNDGERYNNDNRRYFDHLYKTELENERLKNEITKLKTPFLTKLFNKIPKIKVKIECG